MDLLQMRYVVKIAEYGSFSRASADLFVTQSTLSQQIKKLEATLGVSLFERSTRSVKLTNAGAKFVELAIEILRRADELSSEMAELSRNEHTILSIGLMPNLMNYSVPQYLSSFQSYYHNIQLEIHSDWSNSLLNLVMHKKLDFAFVNLGFEQMCELSQTLDFFPFIEDHLVAIGHPNSVLKDKTFISPEDLRTQQFVDYPKDSSMHHMMNAFFTKYSIQPIIYCTCPSIEMVIELLRSNIAISMISSTGAQRYKDLLSIPIRPSQKYVTAIVTIKGIDHNWAHKCFLDYTHGIVHEEYISQS